MPWIIPNLAHAGPRHLGRHAQRRCPHAPALTHSPLRLLQHPATTAALTLVAAREFWHDKNPKAAPRIAARGLSLRTLGAALAGAAWYQAHGRSAWRGALLGGAVGAAATFGWYELRKAITEQTGLPPNVVGVGEDVLLWGAGAALLARLARPAA